MSYKIYYPVLLLNKKLSPKLHNQTKNFRSAKNVFTFECKFAMVDVLLIFRQYDMTQSPVRDPPNTSLVIGNFWDHFTADPSKLL